MLGKVTPDRAGTFTATTTYPAFGDTTGAVSLKAEAWDTTGDRVELTSKRAITLRETKHASTR